MATQYTAREQISAELSEKGEKAFEDNRVVNYVSYIYIIVWFVRLVLENKACLLAAQKLPSPHYGHCPKKQCEIKTSFVTLRFKSSLLVLWETISTQMEFFSREFPKFEKSKFNGPKMAYVCVQNWRPKISGCFWAENSTALCKNAWTIFYYRDTAINGREFT